MSDRYVVVLCIERGGWRRIDVTLTGVPDEVCWYEAAEAACRQTEIIHGVRVLGALPLESLRKLAEPGFGDGAN